MPSNHSFFLLNYAYSQYATNFSELTKNDLISFSNNASSDKKLVLLAPYYKHCNITPKLLFFLSNYTFFFFFDFKITSNMRQRGIRSCNPVIGNPFETFFHPTPPV